MVALGKLCLFTHTRLLLMLLSTTFFTFIFPFKTQQCCAWTILGTSSMFCFTLLKLLDVCRWILVSLFFYDNWYMLCQRLKSCTSNICSQRRHIYCWYPVRFPHYLFGFALFCSLLLSSCSLFVHFLFVSWVFNFFVSINIFCNNLLVSCSLPELLGLHYLLVCCCLLVVYLFISFVVVWVSNFFVYINIFLQQSTFFLVWILSYNLAMLLP
jgi:hypothetical protein